MNQWQELSALIPSPPDFIIDWQGLEASPFGGFLSDMKKTQQNPVWHGEGNVFNHTKLVCERLASFPEFRALLDADRQILFLSALLHDIGKIPATRMENGAWTSPGHSAVGARMARETLWQHCGLSGDAEKIRIRESICLFIRYHMIPVRMLEEKRPEARMLKIAASGALAPAFTMRALCMLSKADVLGRVAEDLAESAEKVELCLALSEELGCADRPYAFRNDFTQRSFFSGRNVPFDQELFDPSWGEVLLLSGLPGTGKDTFLRTRYPQLPVVSLDDIRIRMGIKQTEDQGCVVQAANEEARGYLRKKQPFAWNATNVTAMSREKLVRLFEGYGASVHIVYLETALEDELKRNNERSARVPEHVIFRMLGNLQLPERYEAAKVSWVSV